MLWKILVGWGYQRSKFSRNSTQWLKYKNCKRDLIYLKDACFGIPTVTKADLDNFSLHRPQVIRSTLVPGASVGAPFSCLSTPVTWVRIPVRMLCSRIPKPCRANQSFGWDVKPWSFMPKIVYRASKKVQWRPNKSWTGGRACLEAYVQLTLSAVHAATGTVLGVDIAAIESCPLSKQKYLYAEWECVLLTTKTRSNQFSRRGWFHFHHTWSEHRNISIGKTCNK